jgi:signal transduction histidine kinase
MNAHNGKIKIESERGKGSTFTLLFPLGGKDE